MRNLYCRFIAVVEATLKELRSFISTFE